MTRVRKTPLIGVATALAAFVFPGCSPTEPACLDICSMWAEVRGIVSDAAGVPLAAVDVELKLLFDKPIGGEITCESRTEEPQTRLVSDADGDFSGIISATSIMPPDCIEVTALPPAGSGLRPAADTIVASWSLDRDDPPVTTLMLRLIE
jgi:hypothetical protein